MLEKSILSSKMTFLQNNVGRNMNCMYTCLQIGFEKKIDFILIQEPWIFENNTVKHSSYYCILPEYQELRSRVAIYSRKQSRFQACLRTDICSNNDILVIDIQDIKNQLQNIQLINIYNEKSLKENNNNWTVQRELLALKPQKYSIVCGDFNAHNPWWNSESQAIRSSDLVDWLLEYDFELLNKPDQSTFLRPNCKNNSVIDLTFISPELNTNQTEWFIDKEEDSGSDHELIKFSIDFRLENLVENPIHSSQYKLDKADWDKINKDLEKMKLESQFQWNITEYTAENLENEANKLEKLILTVINQNIPKKRFSEYSKPWWNENLTILRKEMKKIKKQWQNNISTWQDFQNSRNIYFSAIKDAKSQCWNNFLENAEGKDIFKAFHYTKQRMTQKLPILEYKQNNLEYKAISFDEKCQAFLSTLFQKPPSSEAISWDKYQENKSWNWPEITDKEIKEAIFTSSAAKAPGPQGISFLIIQKVYNSLEKEFNRLYKILIEYGYHPLSWREAIGVVLSKPNKKASLPKSYRIISLLDCMGKISEKIIATRLSYLAFTTDLLYHDQIGGRKQRSAIDAVMSLVHDIQAAKSNKLITSALFLDIKGAFDHVSANKLLKICQKLGLPKSLILWLECFLNQRSIQLAFDGNIQEKQSIEIGIPQGSPISPILFLIYIKDLFKERELTDIRIPSYLDDIGLIVSSKSAEENCKKLKQAALELFQLQKNHLIEFDKEKTELIHFFTNSQESIQFSNDFTVKPKSSLRWLGIWLDSYLKFKIHVEKRILAAQIVLNSIIRLSNTERGLSFQAMRQLYIACISTVADYGVQIWWNNQKNLLDKYQKLQNTALRKILGVFKTSPIKAMEIEAAIPPPIIRFKKLCANYALRILKIDSEHPIRKRISDSFPPYEDGIELDWNKYLDWNENSHNTSKKFISQLFRISSYIKNFIPSLKIEKSSNTSQSPWKNELSSLINIKISSLSKEEEALAHKQQLDKIYNQNPNSLIIYTDGSKTEESEYLGAGVAIKYRNTYHNFSYNLGKNCEVFDAELYTIEKALKHVNISTYAKTKQTWIFSDSQAAIQRLQNRYSGAGQEKVDSIYNIAHKLTKDLNIEIYIRWVPAHMNIEGNELADTAAKAGTKASHLVNDKRTSLSFIKRKIKESCLNDWTLNWNSNKASQNHYSQFETVPKWKPSSLKTNKQIWSSICQLKLGHGYFKAYLKRFAQYESENCLNCRVKQNPEHLLLQCTQYNEQRAQVKQKHNIEIVNMKFLFNTKVGNKFLVDYLSTTKIATRNWLESQ